MKVTRHVMSDEWKATIAENLALGRAAAGRERRIADRRHAQAFPLSVRWWILVTRWPEVSWKARWIDLVYLVTG